jgi:hypothetical protein
VNDATRASAVFGSFDGCTSVAGVLGAVGTHPHLLLAPVIGLAVASAVGMGAGEWLSETKTHWSVVVMMALATLTGTILPALPMLIWAGFGPVVVAIVLGLIMAIMIGRIRSKTKGNLAYGQTTGILIAATALAILAARVGGAA